MFLNKNYANAFISLERKRKEFVASPIIAFDQNDFQVEELKSCLF
jgi:hypothetical protein